MHWIIAISLDGHAMGAVRFTRWLTNRAEDHVEGLHVLRRSEHFGLAERALSDLLASSAANGTFAPHVIDHADVASALAEACDTASADLLVLGRTAQRHERAPVRLGRVTRRMLRTLPAPLAIVPADFEPAKAGTGPVIVATDLTDDSASACRHAAMLAKRLRREVVPLHVVPDPGDWGIAVLSAAQVEAFADELRTGATARARAWCARHELGAANVELRMGDVVEQTLRVANERDAPVVVLGSRRLGLIARLFTSSVGAATAATAPCPIVVVPPASH